MSQCRTFDVKVDFFAETFRSVTVSLPEVLKLSSDRERREYVTSLLVYEMNLRYPQRWGRRNWRAAKFLGYDKDMCVREEIGDNTVSIITCKYVDSKNTGMIVDLRKEKMPSDDVQATHFSPSKVDIEPKVDLSNWIPSKKI